MPGCNENCFELIIWINNSQKSSATAASCCQEAWVYIIQLKYCIQRHWCQDSQGLLKVALSIRNIFQCTFMATRLWVPKVCYKTPFHKKTQCLVYDVSFHFIKEKYFYKYLIFHLVWLIYRLMQCRLSHAWIIVDIWKWRCVWVHTA